MELNPDQFAIPGLEEHSKSPALSKALAAGYSFQSDRPGEVTAVHPDVDPDPGQFGNFAGELYWNPEHKWDESLAPGEIGWVNVHHEHRREGIAEAMYDLARTGQYGHKARHSSDRSPSGEKFAQAMKAKGKGGIVPKRKKKDY